MARKLEIQGIMAFDFTVDGTDQDGSSGKQQSIKGN
jgi:hypothetical protein